MKSSMLLVTMGLFLVTSVTGGYAGEGWEKRAPFPEPSEELVGASVAGQFYVFGGLGPGWIPQGLVYAYDLPWTNGPRKDQWRCPHTM